MKSEAIDEQDVMSSTEDTSTQETHLLEILTILAKRRKFVLWFTLGTAIATVIIVLLIPNKYTAASIILPPDQNSSMSSMLLGQLGGSGSLASLAGASLGIKNPADMYVALFHSRTVEDAVIHRFGLMARYRTKTMTDTRIALESHSSVALGVKDGLIRITFTDKDPNFAARVANGYVDEFHKQSDGLATTEASQRRLFFQQQLLEASDNLTKAEESMKNTEKTTGVLQLDSQARALVESAAVLRGQITAKEVQLQSMKSFATEDNPQVITVEHELSALKAQLAQIAGPDENGGLGFGLAKSKVPEAGMEYLNRLRDLRYYETIEELIARQFEMAKLDEARQGTIQVVDMAVPPDKHSSPKRTVIAILATMLAFFISCGWCLYANRLEQMKAQPGERQRLEALRNAFR